MKLAKEGDLGLFTHIYTNSLGAPFIGQLNDFVQTEHVIVWLGGQIARIVGLIPAANIMLIISCVVAAFSFYSASRLWKISSLTSWIFAVIYAFLPQSQRSLDHMGVGFPGLLPLQLYCFWYVVTAPKLSWDSFRFKITLLIGLLSGLLNIYWVFLYLQLYSLALLYRALRRRQGTTLALIPFGAAILVLGTVLGSFVIYRLGYGVNTSALVRSYFDVEIGALKLIDLLIPNRISYFDISSRYYNGGKLDIGETWWRAYIGFCAVAGLFFLFFKGIQSLINKRAPSLPFLAVSWVLAYSSLGGIHAFFSLLFNFYDIRSTTRYSEVIATIGLIYCLFKVHHLVKNWSLRARIFALTILALLAVWDQSFKFYGFPFNDNIGIKERVRGDKILALNLEERLGEGAMSICYLLWTFLSPSGEEVLIRPTVSYHFFYNSMQPFLYSKNLRYSYGSNKGRQGADWQLDVQELPSGEMAATLESYGFSGILLNRKCYKDGGVRQLAELAEAGWPMELEQGFDNEWVFIRLTPAEKPSLPTLTPYAFPQRNKSFISLFPFRFLAVKTVAAHRKMRRKRGKLTH